MGFVRFVLPFAAVGLMRLACRSAFSSAIERLLYSSEERAHMRAIMTGCVCPTESQK